MRRLLRDIAAGNEITAICVIVGRLRLRGDGSNRRAGAKPQAAKKEAKCYKQDTTTLEDRSIVEKLQARA